MNAVAETSVSIAVLSSSSVQLFAEELRKELQRWGWEGRIWQSGFKQYRQDIANPTSPLYSNRSQAVILHLDGEDLFAECLRNPFDFGEETRRQRARDAATEVETQVRLIRSRLPEAIVVLNTVFLSPIHALTGLEYHSPLGLSDLAAHYNLELWHIARRNSDVLVHDIASLASYAGYKEWFDGRLWYLARSRLSNKATNILARSAGALLRAWKGQTRKCLVLDLDNTLWGGIIGEDGIEGIALGEEGIGLAYAEFQQELVNLARKGVLLGICSKNNEEDALEVLRSHPSMRLREEDFAARKINWIDKATNLRQLAFELNIGLDSLVFIDDNIAERVLVRTSLPEVYVPDWPDEPSEFRGALLELAWHHFGRVSLTKEDQGRTAMYRIESQQRSLAESSANLGDYFRSLQMHARIGYADRFTIPRIAQLTQKTNQFNLTTRRYSESDIRGLADSPDALVSWLHLRDRFGDEGIVGVVILRLETASSWRIDTFLLSCRVIGRNVEKAFLGRIFQELKQSGATELIGEYSPTSKNGLAANVYRDLGFELIGNEEGATRWVMPIDRREISIPDCIEVEFTREKPLA